MKQYFIFFDRYEALFGRYSSTFTVDNAKPIKESVSYGRENREGFLSRWQVMLSSDHYDNIRTFLCRFRKIKNH